MPQSPFLVATGLFGRGCSLIVTPNPTQEDGVGLCSIGSQHPILPPRQRATMLLWRVFPTSLSASRILPRFSRPIMCRRKTRSYVTGRKVDGDLGIGERSLFYLFLFTFQSIGRLAHSKVSPPLSPIPWSVFRSFPETGGFPDI